MSPLNSRSAHLVNGSQKWSDVRLTFTLLVYLQVSCSTNFVLTLLVGTGPFDRLYYQGDLSPLFSKEGWGSQKRVGTNIDLRKRISSSSNSPRSVASGSVLQCSGHPATLPAHSVQRQDCPAQSIFNSSTFLRLFCHLCWLGQCQSEFHNPVRRGEARLNSTMAHLEWRQGQTIAQLDSRRGNKATGPGAIGLSLQDLPSGKEKRQGWSDQA